MKHLLFIVFAALAYCPASMAGTLSEADARALQTKVGSLIVIPGPAQVRAMVDLTHHSAHQMVGGKAAFQAMARKHVDEMAPYQIKQISAAAGVPTRTYLAGKEEVCFVPTTTVVMMKGMKLKKTAYLVAIRPVGGGDKWTYLDSGAFTDKPEVLYLFLPQLERGVVPPPSRIQRAG